MIGPDIATATAMRDALHDLIGLERLDATLSSLAVEVSRTVDDPSFPGALVPVVDTGGNLSVFAAAQTQRDWRRLAPLLRAFAGPTLTSFSGTPEALPAGSAVADVLLAATPSTTAVLRLPSEHRQQVAALRGLTRLKETIARAPDLRRGAPEPTSWLIAKLQDHLNMGRPVAAERILSRLRTEMRLDSLNLAALEVQILAVSGDWTGIVSLPTFASLCAARRTPATTALLLEALYHVHLQVPFEAGDQSASRTVFETDIRPVAQRLLGAPLVASAKAGAWRLLALEALSGAASREVQDALHIQAPILGWLAAALASLSQTDASPPEPAPSEKLDVARQALTETGRVESLDSVASVLAALGDLSDEDLDRLRSAEPFRTLLQSVEVEASAAGLPTDWAEWFSLAADPAFTNALEVARAGAEEWSLADVASDPIHVQALVGAIEKSQNDALAIERANLAMPFLIAWLRQDEGFPRPALRPLYSILLTVSVLSADRGRSTYESSYLLIHALLASGLTAAAYRDLITDVRDLAGDGFGVDMAYWLLEVVEDFMAAGASDDAARSSFLHDVLSKLAPLYGRLSSLQRSVIGDFAEELGWSLEGLGFANAQEQASKPDSLSEKLSGRRIAIYTLTESTSRQAKTAIENASPGAIVDCSADHGGSLRLKALAENSDLFVLVWQSAKHAATDFIREHRGSKPLLYASGRGVSSILRAIEDHLATG